MLLAPGFCMPPHVCMRKLMRGMVVGGSSNFFSLCGADLNRCGINLLQDICVLFFKIANLKTPKMSCK